MNFSGNRISFFESSRIILNPPTHGVEAFRAYTFSFVSFKECKECKEFKELRNKDPEGKGFTPPLPLPGARRRSRLPATFF